MSPLKNITPKSKYKFLISFLFGFIGGLANLLNFIIYDYPIQFNKIFILLGNLGPLLVTFAWGWKYGLFSFFSGIFETYFLLWSYNYFFFFYYCVKMIFWLTFHDKWLKNVSNKPNRQWYHSKYLGEIIFQLVNLSIFMICNSIISIFCKNNQISIPCPDMLHGMGIPYFFLRQIIGSFIFLSIIDIHLNLKSFRKLFKLDQTPSVRNNPLIYRLMIYTIAGFWLLCTFITFFLFNDENLPFLDVFWLKIPNEDLMFRYIIILVILISGLMINNVMRRIENANYILNKSGKKMLEAQKMDNLGNLSIGIAHDINNKLTGVIGFSEILLESEENPERKEMLRTIINESFSASNLTKNLLEYAREKPMNRNLLHINKIIEKSVVILKRTSSKTIEIRFKHKTESDEMIGDSIQLDQCIMNLSINAIQSMPEGGILTISTESIEDHKKFDKVASKIYGGFIKISIKDTGMGIPSNVLPHIFEPFFTTKKEGIIKGTGLGLSTVSQIINSHEGIIELNTKEGEGTEFVLILPKHANLLKKKSNSIQNKDYQPNYENGNLSNNKNFNILLIDDEKAIRDIFSKFCKTLEVKITSFKNGLTGFEKFSQNPQTYDIVFLDLDLPDQNGLIILEKMRNLNPEVPIIIITGFSESQISHKIEQIKRRNILYKPFSLSDINNMIELVID